MYYEEKIIDGVLCHRGTPDGEWIPFTIEQLSEMQVESQRVLHFRNGQLFDLQSTITAQEDVIKRLREDAEYWYEFSGVKKQMADGYCDTHASWLSDKHTQLMNELGEKLK